MHGFLSRTIKVAEHDHAGAMHNSQQWVFFDRSVIDAASALQELTGDPVLATVQSYQYHPLVFLAPPWPEIFMRDTERRHDMNTALAEFNRLQQVYLLLGYTVSFLPKVGVAERADFVLNTLADH